MALNLFDIKQKNIIFITLVFFRFSITSINHFLLMKTLNLHQY